MRSRLFPALTLVLGSLLGTVACERPEVAAFRKAPAPVSVRFAAPAAVRDREAVEKDYGAVMRARLATRVVVVPEGVQPPAGAAELRVEVLDYRPGTADPSPAAVGTATGVAVGVLSAAAGNRDAIFDGLFWGLWAGHEAAWHQHEDRDRLGYRPNRIRAEVRLVRAGDPEPLDVFQVGAREVLDAMDPLPVGLKDDPERIREEEARGFARVVVQRLSERFGWTAGDARWYRDPAAREDDGPRPAPDMGPEPEPKAPEKP